VLGADTTTEGLACTALLEDCKKSLLRMHPWNFAVKRKKIIPFQDVAVSNVTFVSANLIEATHTATTYVAGNYVTLTGIAGAVEANGTWEVASITSTTITRLTTVDIDLAADLSTYEASTTDYIRRSPAFDYSYLFVLPSDCLRVVCINGDYDLDAYRIEGGFILSDEEVLEIIYVSDVTDYALMDPLFYQCLATYLAYNLCDHLTASDGKKNELHVYLYGGQGKRGIMPQAKFVDGSEDSLQQMGASEWVDSRGSGTGLA
jgi:hypothetical protein